MFGSAIFEAVIGTVVIYILLSLVCLVLNEWITRLLDLRSGILRKELGQLLGPELAKALAEQPLIKGTFDRKRFPNYIPASTFAVALMELGYDYTPGTSGAPGTTRVKTRWEGSSHLLLDALRLAATSMGPIQTRIEKWFDLAMEQASGKFKRIANNWILAFSAAIVGAGNVDTISIASNLYDGALTHSATRFTLFWSGPQPDWYLRVPGLVLTWAAVSLGAPFWFDILNKLVNLRQTGLPPDENKRQTAGTPISSQ
jgi:hypothetical protein